MVCEVSHAGCDVAPIHLQIVAWHEDVQQVAGKIPVKITDIKTILMPRQHVLRRLDPHGDRDANEMCLMFVDLVNQYMDTVKDGRIPPELDVNQVLDIY